MTENTVEIPAGDLEVILRAAESRVDQLEGEIAKCDDDSRHKSLLEELKVGYEVSISATKRRAEEQDAELRL